MEEGLENTSRNDREREEIFSKAVRAGKRTYFFDVKATRGNDYYLTITESKKRFGDDGKFFYEKHKLFLYKEDFEKFSNGLAEAIDKIKEIAPHYADAEITSDDRTVSSAASNGKSEGFSDVSFEDLGN